MAGAHSLLSLAAVLSGGGEEGGGGGARSSIWQMKKLRLAKKKVLTLTP